MFEKSNTPTDTLSLVKKIRNGDAYAFRTLFKLFYKDLVNYAHRYVQNLQTAEDIASDVFLIIWERRSELDIKTNIKAYMIKMVRNRCINYLKNNRMERMDAFQLNLSVPSDELTDERVNINDLEKHIVQAITELPDRTRDVFVLCRYDNFKYAEIAEILDIKVGTVETHMVRALKYLRKRLAFLL